MQAKGSPTVASAPAPDPLDVVWKRVVGRRSFLMRAGLVGATAVVPGSLFAGAAAGAERPSTRATSRSCGSWRRRRSSRPTCGCSTRSSAARRRQPRTARPREHRRRHAAVHLRQHRRRGSHAEFLNAYCRPTGAEPVNLDKFRTLPSSKATGAKQIGRLTNLKHLNVDTSWYTRYRGTGNPDFGATFPQAVTIINQPAIPISDTETPPGHPAGAAGGKSRSDECRRSRTPPASTSQ